MEDTKLGRQERAVLGEYEHALRVGASVLAERIVKANPDLKAELNRVCGKVLHTKKGKP